MTGMLVADSPRPFDPALPPSSSLLLYLFAERVLPAVRRGTALPLSGRRVDTMRLACALFAVAFWRLRQLGLLHMELQQGRHLHKTNASVRSRGLSAPTAHAVTGMSS